MAGPVKTFTVTGNGTIGVNVTNVLHVTDAGSGTSTITFNDSDAVSGISRTVQVNGTVAATITALNT